MGSIPSHHGFLLSDLVHEFIGSVPLSACIVRLVSAVQIEVEPLSRAAAR